MSLPSLVRVLLVALMPYVTIAAEPSSAFEEIGPIVQRGIEAGDLPGAVVMVADSDSILFQTAYGHRQLEPKRERMTVDTVFDLASLTKPVATATSVMLLVQQGKVDVQQPVAKYLPEFGVNGKEQITVADLLLHRGGLIPDNPLDDYLHGSDRAWQQLWELKLRSKPGEKFAYTDVGFLVLGKMVERVSGESLDRFTEHRIFQPLGMKDTGYTPPASLRDRIAPTEKRGDRFIRGEVHDPRAHALGGVAGHAGLFSTAADLVRYGQMLLAVSHGSRDQILRPDTFALMTEPRQLPQAGGEPNGELPSTRTYGWDHRSPYSSNRGKAFSETAFGHGGFTGTVMWIDPLKDRVFVFLSNRLHPDGQGAVNRLAGEIATLIGEAANDQ